MAWRVANSLLKLREQVNATWPRRDKSNDGTIGDAAHASRNSDHNPWVTDGHVGVVTAIDITNDPAHGVVSRDIAERLRQSRDSRIKYIISNRQIVNSSDWKWKAYKGPNPHIAHAHISVKALKSVYDNVKSWELTKDKPDEPTKPITDIASSVSLGDMAHLGEQGARVTLIQQALKAAGLLPLVDGDYGPLTRAAVKTFQAAKGVEVDGIVGPDTAAELDKYLQETPPAPVPPPAIAQDWQSGRGSWYSQYEGRSTWKDTGDAPGSNALGVPDSAQGVSFYNAQTLGKWFEVQYPNGRKSIEQQTDIGPAPWTGKKIDISAVAAERAGYRPDNFPTGAVIKWRPIDKPVEVASLQPRDAAVRFRNTRTNLA